MRKTVLNLLLLTLPMALTACGAIYTSPNIDRSNQFVEVVETTPETIEQANRTSYTPRQLPHAFKSTGAADGRLPLNVAQKRPSSSKVKTTRPPQLPSEPYRIGISDVLLLATPAPTSPNELTGLIAAQNRRQGYTVQDDGAIAVPDVGRVDLAGLTLAEAENAIFRALVDKQIDTQFSLEVAEFNSQKVSISGAVNKPALVPISLQPLSLQNALQAAGGVSTADFKFGVARISRNGKSYQISLKDLHQDTSLQRTRLQSGDSIYVEVGFNIQRELELTQALNAQRQQAMSENKATRDGFLQQLELGAIKADYVYITGEVQRQNRYRLPFENKASLAEALYAESGININKGDFGQIYVLRKTQTSHNSKPIVAFHLDGSDVSNLLFATQLELRPNDVIFVAEQKITSWNRVVSSLLPTLTVVDQQLAN